MHAITRINELWPYLWLYQPSTATILLFPSFIPHASISPSLLLSSSFSSRDCFRIETNATITWSFLMMNKTESFNSGEEENLVGSFRFYHDFFFPKCGKKIVSKSIFIKVIEEFWGSTRNIIFIYMISILLWNFITNAFREIIDHMLIERKMLTFYSYIYQHDQRRWEMEEYWEYWR